MQKSQSGRELYRHLETGWKDALFGPVSQACRAPISMVDPGWALSVPVTTVWGGRALRLQETLNLPAQLVRPFKLTEKGVGQIDTLVATATATAVAPPFPLRLAPGEEVVGVRCPFSFHAALLITRTTACR